MTIPSTMGFCSSRSSSCICSHRARATHTPGCARKINPSKRRLNVRSEQQASFCARPGAGRGRCRHGGRGGNGHARPVGCHSHGLRASRRWVGVNNGKVLFSFFLAGCHFVSPAPGPPENRSVLPKVEHCRLHGDSENSMYMSFCVSIIYLFLSPCFFFLFCHV